MTLEICSVCGEPTGRAGKGEDSLYAGDFGPYCEVCWGDVPENLANDIYRLRAALRSIADNTCCDGCGEAALAAKHALQGEQKA